MTRKSGIFVLLILIAVNISMLLFLNFFFAPNPQTIVPASIYDHKVEALDGGTIDFSTFKGKKILIVNTASKCGFTPQYQTLEDMYGKYRDRMVIIGFPANNFFFQEPKGNKDIAEFCKKNYGVSFPMAAKVSVKGRNMAPIYRWLTEKKYNKLQDSKVSWNFQKYLINEKGELTDIFSPATKPDSKEMIEAIEK